MVACDREGYLPCTVNGTVILRYFVNRRVLNRGGVW